MPRYKIKVKDSKKAREREVARNMIANIEAIEQSGKMAVGAMRNDNAFMRKLHKRIEEQVKERPAGTIHDVANTECPDGGTNCRNCGDPSFVVECAAAGHCPHCGTRHGLAPDSVVAANGYELEEV